MEASQRSVPCAIYAATKLTSWNKIVDVDRMARQSKLVETSGMPLPERVIIVRRITPANQRLTSWNAISNTGRISHRKKRNDGVENIL